MKPANELEAALGNVQDYVDGTMSRRESVRFYLLVQRHPELAAEVAVYRSLALALDADVREEPSARFNDAAILASVPYEHYASAPRRLALWPVIERVPFLARWLRRTRRAALAALAAYGLVLLSGHSLLAAAVANLSRGIHEQLNGWVEASSGVPVFSSLVAALSGCYGLLSWTIASLDALFGTPLLTLALGMTLGVMGWHAAAAAGRRREASREAV